MNMLKKLIAVTAVTAMLGSTSNANAQVYQTGVGGCGYEECCTSPCIAPAVALGTIALIAIVAVAVQNSSHSGHCHD
jgi:hypothetical protein